MTLVIRMNCEDQHKLSLCDFVILRFRSVPRRIYVEPDNDLCEIGQFARTNRLSYTETEGLFLFAASRALYAPKSLNQ